MPSAFVPNDAQWRVAVMMLLQQEKFGVRTNEFSALRYHGLKPLRPFVSMASSLNQDAVHTSPPPLILGDTLTVGDRFCGRDRYIWLETKLALPKAKPGYRVIGLFDFGTGDSGCSAGFESLLWVNGVEYQAVDTNHQEVIFDDFAGQTVKLTFLLWTGLGGKKIDLTFEHRINRADVGYLHTAANEFYYLFRSGTETLALLPQEDSGKYPLAAAMEDALQLLDFDQFQKTVPEALTLLRNRFSALKQTSDVTVHCVGHTHIDVAYLWRLKHTREKAQRSFTTVLRLMEEYPDYHFLQTQPQLYRYLKQDNPALYARIKERVREGRWEVDGGMWLEADCNISSGEALTRQFLHGIRFFEEEFGYRCRYLWLPDVFGYSWALPQILHGVGISTFMTTKISWNQFNTMPNDLFHWRGIDGTEMLTYFITTPTPEARHLGERYSTYNGTLMPKTILGSWYKFRNKDVCKDVLLAYGYGDGGGGVNREMLEMEQAMEQTPGLPNVKKGRAGDFFATLHEQTKGKNLPVWDGELYLEYHRGTYTTQANNKKKNRLLELALTKAEWLCVMAAQEGSGYPQEMLQNAWEIVLRNQFHDIIPGSSIREVYADSMAEYREAERLVDAATHGALAQIIAPRENWFTLINGGSFLQNQLVFLPITENGGFVQNGQRLKSQKTVDGYLVSVSVPPLSLVPIQFVAGEFSEATTTIQPSEMAVETPFYQIEWNSGGTITRLFDKENEREVLKGFGNLLAVYEDKPLNYDAWDIDVFYPQKVEFPDFLGATVTEMGSLRTVIRFSWQYRRSTITQEMILSTESRRIDFKTNVNWQETNRLLRTSFDTNIRSTKASYDIQYGHCERPNHRNTSWDMARFEVVAHKWADLSEENYGVSLLNDCKYGNSALGNTLSLSLLRSPKMPDPTADMGEHSFTYSLLPHKGSVTQGDTIPEATALNQPVVAVPGTCKQESLFTVNGGVVVVDAVKKAEDGDDVILRVHECLGGTQKVAIGSSMKKLRVRRCTLLEEAFGEEAEEISATLHPFEIATWRIAVER